MRSLKSLLPSLKNTTKYLVIKIITTKIEWLGVIKMKSRLLNYYERKNLKAKLRDNLHVKKMKSNSV